MKNFTLVQFWGKLLQRNLLNFKDPLNMSKTVLIKTKYVEVDLVNNFLVEQSNTLIRRTLQTFVVTTRQLLSAEKFYTKTNMKILH